MDHLIEKKKVIIDDDDDAIIIITTTTTFNLYPYQTYMLDSYLIRLNKNKVSVQLT